MFSLDKQLQKESITVTELELCLVQFMNNKYFPWVVLVPRLEKVVELTDLSTEQQHQLIEEVSFVTGCMKQHFKADKMNVAALGNMVRQLHVHVIARYKKDTAWPHPVWNTHSAPYPADQLKQHVQKLKQLLHAV